MEERGNKTIMCSVLFLDIVEYSKKSVAEQISLKDRFNSYLSDAIRDVPIADRIILDAVDGVAINFLGDVEEALKTALSLRESLLNEDPNLDPRLLVRMGINLGPVRLVRDVNGQPSIVGDGINVAQRVMGFADASQILVSRSYYDAVLRLFSQYAGLFRYQGSRTDKHVREHEIFAIGYPEDKVILTADQTPLNWHSGAFRTQSNTNEQVSDHAGSSPVGLLERAKTAWYSAATRLDVLIWTQNARFRKAGHRQRAAYVGVVAIPMLLLIALLVRLADFGETPGEPVNASPAQSASGAPPSLSLRFSADINTLPAEASGVSSTSMAGSRPKPPKYDPWQDMRVTPNADNQANKSTKDSAKQKSAEILNVEALGVKLNEFVQNITKRLAPAPSNAPNADAIVIVDCTDGASVHVDGQRKGTISSGAMTLSLPPGKHLIGINDMTRGSIYSQEVALEAGKTITIKPTFCL